MAVLNSYQYFSFNIKYNFIIKGEIHRMKKIVKKIGCCLLVGSMAFQGMDTNTVYVRADSVQNIDTSNYWSGTTATYSFGGVQWEYLKLHYNGSTYSSSEYEEYITNMKVISISDNVTEIIIPDKINNCKVKGLGENALENLTKIKSVKIPKTIERICNQAFQGCSALTDVQFEDITTLKAIGEYAFKDCTSFHNSTIVEKLITSGNLQKGMFENCTSLEKVTIEGEEVKIPDFAFSGCSNLKDIVISDNVKSLEIGEGGFQNTVLHKVEFPCKTKLKKNAFCRNYNLNKVIFKNDADIGESCFLESFGTDFSNVEKSIEFESGTVKIGLKAFERCAGLRYVIFNDELISTDIAYKAFWETGICSLNFRGNNVCIEDEGLSGMDNLSELTFYNTYTLLKEEPFYGRYHPTNKKINSNLKKITFDCEKVCYEGDEIKDASYTQNYGTFYGLTDLEEVICGQRCKTFECTLKAVEKEKSDKDCNALDTFYFKNISVNLDNFKDERSGKNTQLYGYQDSVGSYVNQIKTDTQLCNTRNQAVYYKPISTGLTVIYNGEDIVEGNEINTDNLEVYETYRDGTKSDRIPYSDMTAESDIGYKYTHGAYQLNGRDFLNITYTIIYGDSNCNLPVRIIKKAANHFDITYIGTEKIEGQTVSENDFVISNITYNDQSVEESADDEFSVKLTGADRLEKGSNTIQVTYKGKTIPYTLNAKKKEIEKLDIVPADNSKKLFEGGILSKQDFIVTARYNNGDIEENYTDYTLQNTIVEQDITNVTFVSGDYTQNYQYHGIPLKVDHLNVSYNDRGVEENGKVDKNDLKVTAVYNTGKEVVLTQEEYSFKTYTIIGGKTNTVFVIYNGDSEVQEVPFNVTGIITNEEKEKGQSVDLKPAQSMIPEPIHTAMPEMLQSPEPKQSTMPEMLQSSEPIQTVIPELNQTAEPEQSVALETIQSPEPSQSESLGTIQSEEPIQTIMPEQMINTDNISNTETVVLEKTKYTVGVQEKIKIKLCQGTAKSFRSKNKKIATVNKKGIVVAKKNGKVKIIIRDKENRKTSCTITVKKAPEKVYASFAKKTIKVKQSIQVKPKFDKGYYSNKITYTSSNDKVARVSFEGVVTANKKGKAVITLKTYNNKKAKVIINVKK